MKMDDMTYETFYALLGEKFEIALNDGSLVGLNIVEVSKARGENRPDNAFSVVFRGPPEPLLGQGTYVLGSKVTGPLPLFLVPIGETEDGLEYEAVFTRLDPRPTNR